MTVFADAHLDCPGRWLFVTHGTLTFWRCSKCRQLLHGSVSVSAAVHQENLLGIRLLELTSEGRRLLDPKGGP